MFNSVKYMTRTKYGKEAPKEPIKFLFGYILVSLFLFAGCSEKEPQPPPVSPQEVFFQRGQQYSSEGNYIKAVEMFRNAAELEQNPDYYYNLGVSYQKLTLCGEATSAYEQVVDLDPEFAEAWYNMALCYDKINRLDDATRSYDKYKEVINNPGSQK